MNLIFNELDKIRNLIISENKVLLQNGKIKDYNYNCIKLQGISIAFYKIKYLINNKDIVIQNTKKR